MILSIVILNYNTPQYTTACIKSIYHYHKKQINSNLYEIILLDNKSDDKSIEILEKNIKMNKWNITFLKSNRNRGFGGGCNTAVKKAKGKYVLFLNSDAKVSDNSIDEMLSVLLERNDISILGGGLLNEDGSVQYSCGIFPNIYSSIIMLIGLGHNILFKKPPKTIKVDWVGGGCLFVKRYDFNKLGGFDENIFMYFEDVDLCFRATKINMNIYHHPKSNIVHARGKSSNSNFLLVHSYKGYLYFYKKHKNKLEASIICTLFRVKFRIYEYIARFTNNLLLADAYRNI